MQTLLVTGGAGFIGANFVLYWLKTYPSDRVIVLDALTYAGNKENLVSVNDLPNFRFVHGDIRDEKLVESLLIEEKIDLIVNFAAESHVDRSILGPEAFIDTNVQGTHVLLKVAKRIWIDSNSNEIANKRFHQVSTDEVYGSLEATDPAFVETTPYAPNSPYAASKAASDHFVRAYHHTYGLPVTTSNCSNNYGPYQFPEKLIPLTVVNILNGKSLPIYGDGLNIRDWLYVEDHCRGIDLVLKKGHVGEVYNIGGKNEWTNIDIVKLICNLVDKAFEKDIALKDRFPSAPVAQGRDSSSLITYVKDRPGHDRRYAVNADKIADTLGFKLLDTFATGIEKTVNWYLENETWWKNIMDGTYKEWIDKQYTKKKASV